MTCYSKIGLIEGNDLTKIKNSKECIVVHYSYVNHGCQFKDPVFNGCHVSLIISFINNIVVINNIIKGTDYCCIICDIS